MALKFHQILINQLTTLALLILTICIAFMILLLVPLIFLGITVPVGTLRYLLSKSARWIRPDLGKILTLRSTAITADTMYTEPKGNVVVGLLLKGSLDMDRFKATVAQNMMDVKLPNGEDQYPELKQYLTRWCGYAFWKDDKTFKLDSHLSVVSPPESSKYTDADMRNIYQNLMDKPWTRKRPIWEFVVVTNYYPEGDDGGATEHSIVFFRLHHSLGDGYSTLKLITQGISERKAVPQNAVPTYSSRNYWKLFLFYATLPFTCSYEIAHGIVVALGPVPFKPSRKTQTGQFHVNVTDKISIKRIKEVKNHYKVSFASVINSMCTGALRDMMISKGIKFPRSFLFGTVLPLPGHPEKLRNLMAGGLLRIAPEEPDPLKRLQHNSRDYERLKRSVAPVLSRVIPVLGGVVPVWVLEAGSKDGFLACALTNFPGGFDKLSCEGCPCVGVIVAAAPGPFGINFCAFSYFDGVRISPAVNVTVMSKEEVQQLTNLLQKHLDILYERMITDV